MSDLKKRGCKRMHWFYLHSYRMEERDDIMLNTFTPYPGIYRTLLFISYHSHLFTQWPMWPVLVEKIINHLQQLICAGQEGFTLLWKALANPRHQRPDPPVVLICHPSDICTLHKQPILCSMMNSKQNQCNLSHELWVCRLCILFYFFVWHSVFT